MSAKINRDELPEKYDAFSIHSLIEVPFSAIDCDLKFKLRRVGCKKFCERRE